VRTRTFIASLVTAVALTGCAASAEESESPETSDIATSAPSATPTEPAAPETSASTPDVSVEEIPTEPAGQVRAQGWTGPTDGITITSEVTDKRGATAAANAAMAFLRKWTLREDLMRADLRTAHTALTGVTAELSPNAAVAWQQNLQAAANLKNKDAWGSLQALVRVAATGPEWKLPAGTPLVTNRSFVGDVFVTRDPYAGDMRVGIDYSVDFQRLADPNKPKAGLMRVTHDTSLSLVMTRGANGWEIFSWQGSYKSSDPVLIN
jgi:hypothetical protein